MSARRSAVWADWAALSRWRWWARTRPPFLAAMTVLLVPSVTAWQMLAIMATVVAGAAFGFGLNEVADRASDARAGKRNRAAEMGRGRWLAFLIVAPAGALGLSLAWAPDPTGPALVLFALGLAVAYSAPPLRLKGRGGAGLAAAVAAGWAVPVLVVAAAQPGGLLRPAPWLLAAMGAAVGTRSEGNHQLQDILRDRRSGVQTYASAHGGIGGLLLGAFACELVLLGAGLAWTWPRSAPAAIALVPSLAQQGLLLWRGPPLSTRLASIGEAPLATYYFVALPIALAAAALFTAMAPALVGAMLLALAAPQLIATTRYWRTYAGSFTERARTSTHSAVVSASEPQPILRLGPPQ